MGTRSGDIDPAIIEFICEKENISVNEMTSILNKQSGVLGLSGVSNDYRDVIEAMENGNENAKAALEVFTYRILKYIGAYYIALGGVDAIALTAGAGENNLMLRKEILQHLGAIGVVPDPEVDEIRGKELLLTKPESKVQVWVVPTNEELAIARETAKLV